MLKRSGENKPQTGIFQSHLALNEALSAEDMYADFLHHEHYVWHSARPRSAHGTVELRSAGQQPPKEHMVASALGLGIVQGGERLEQLLHKEFGAESWAVMRSWHHEVVKHGLKAEAPTPTLLTDILDIAAESLDDRKLNEARFLSPLYSRIKLKENPAQRALASYHSAGMEGMLSLVRCT
jgi:gamma-glutamylcysteine synthetase